MGSPGWRIPWNLAGSPLDDGQPQEPRRPNGLSTDAHLDLQLIHCERGQATSSSVSRWEGRFPAHQQIWDGLVFLRGSMVVMPVLALLAIIVGFGANNASAQSSLIKVQPATAAGTASGMTEALALESEQPTILEFSTTWCGPCKEMKPHVEELIRKDYPVRVLDAEEQSDLAHNYRVTRVPTFVVVDPEGNELGRSEGVQSASALASQFRVIKSKWAEARKQADQQAIAANDVPVNEPHHHSRASQKFGEPGETIDAEHEADHAKPWQTVVRIVVHGGGVMGFGSGTIISSNAEGTLILTCAHIFKIDGQREQYAPKQFPRQVTVDLFDGVLRGQELKTATRGIPAQVIDYDFQSDVGLISISPGYTLPASPVVPENWKPSPNMKMITAGCSGGRDATLWNTSVVKPESRMLLNRKPYDAIECLHEPTQGRSGGGLFTLDHYVAGVCDMAVVGGQRGLYATPKSIHTLLGRNGFDSLYKRQLQGFDQGQMLAQNNPPRTSRQPAVRAQGPDDLTIPPPSLLGVTEPSSAGLPPAGSLAMDERMTENPVKTVPTTTEGWNGGSRFRKIAQSSESQSETDSDSKFSLPNARLRNSNSLQLADNDLVPIKHKPDPAEVALEESAKPETAQTRTTLVDNHSDSKPHMRQAVNSARNSNHTPRVRLMPVQDLDTPEDSGSRQWNSNRGGNE